MRQNEGICPKLSHGIGPETSMREERDTHDEKARCCSMTVCPENMERLFLLKNFSCRG